jgi:hypothetical protein
MSAVSKSPCLHRRTVDTAKGRWLINVDRCWASSNDLLTLEITVLNLNKACEEFRSLLAILRRNDLQSPSRCSTFTKRIGRWIEKTDEDGYLNLSVAV